MSGNEVYSVTLTYQHHTPSAVCVENDEGEPVWLPLSVIETTQQLDTLV